MIGVEAGGGERPRPGLADGLRSWLRRRASGAEAVRLVIFAQELFARRAGYLDELPVDELGAAVQSAYRFYAAPGEAIRVRVVDPTYLDEGWDAPLTVIETAMPERPFIVETVRSELAARGVVVRALLAPVFAARRDARGRLESLSPPFGDERCESLLHIGVERIADPAARDALATALRSRLADVRLVTDDSAAMAARAQAMAMRLERTAPEGAGPSAAEARATAEFLRWLAGGAFVFLGSREYTFVQSAGEALLQARAGSGLGLLREAASALATPTPVGALPARVRAWLEGSQLLAVGKATAEAPIHRGAHMDEIAVKELDAAGVVVGERRFVGLFTARGDAEEASALPLLRRHLDHVLAAERVPRGGQDHRAIVGVFDSLPKTALLTSTPAEVLEDVRAILGTDAGSGVAVTLRGGPDRLAALVVLPAVRFAADVRERIEALLRTRLAGTLIDEGVRVAEAEPARLHFVFASAASPSETLAAELRADIEAIVEPWEEQLRAALVARGGDVEGARLAARWARAFGATYRAAMPAASAVADVHLLEALVDGSEPRRATLVSDPTAPDVSLLRIHHVGAPIPAADLWPILEHFGLRPLAEELVGVVPADGRRCGIQSIRVQDRFGRPLAADVGERLGAALAAVWAGQVADDVLNRLVVESALAWHDVAALRAYAGWVAQAGLASRATVQTVLADHPDAAQALVACFASRFRPGDADEDAPARLAAALERVGEVAAAHVLGALADTIDASLKTNAFAASVPACVAITIAPARLGWLPGPRAFAESWVHAPGVEGIHLRAGAYARGDIRVGTCPDALRAEALSALRAQCAANAGIAATGAAAVFTHRAGLPIERAYVTFARGLLDLTDATAARAARRPGVVADDADDRHLVLAPGPGLAALADLANAVAVEVGAPMGERTAPGGVRGWDHRALGVVGRGAWTCIRSHARDVGLEPDVVPLSVVGVGDVLGVLGSTAPPTRLVGAFDQWHIVVDPDPDPARGADERDRLVRTGRGWDAFDAGLLSRGGLIAPRHAKRIALSPEVRTLLTIDDDAASGDAIVRALLRLDVDLLLAARAGLLVRAADEPDALVGDPAHAAVRIEAETLRARIVVETDGAVVTPRGRVAFALGGGRVNGDVVDAAAGLELADREANVALGLAPLVADGRLSPAERDELMAAVADEAVADVLARRHRAAAALGEDQLRSRTQLAPFHALATDLAADGSVDATVPLVPDRDALRARRATSPGLTRPELALTAARTKRSLQDALAAAPWLDDPLCLPFLHAAFPPTIVRRFPGAAQVHPFRRALIAAELAGLLVDRMGTTFAHRVAHESGAPVADVVRAWAMAWRIADGEVLATALATAGLAVDVQSACALALEAVGEGGTTWLLGRRDPRPAHVIADALARDVARVRPHLDGWVVGSEAHAWQRQVSELEIAGVPPALARALTAATWLPAALDVVAIAARDEVDPRAVATRYFTLGDRLDFGWLLARLCESDDDDPWQRRARIGLTRDVQDARRRLARVATDVVDRESIGVQRLMRDLRAAPRVSFAALQVAAHDLRRLADALTHERSEALP